MLLDPELDHYAPRRPQFKATHHNAPGAVVTLEKKPSQDIIQCHPGEGTKQKQCHPGEGT